MFGRKSQEFDDWTAEAAAIEANRYIGLLKERLGQVREKDTSDIRVFALNSGQEGYVDGFTIDKLLFMTTITVNFYEVTYKRTKLFQLDNKSIIGSQYQPTFAHFFLRKIKGIAEQYRLSGDSNNKTADSPYNWYDNSTFYQD